MDNLIGPISSIKRYQLQSRITSCYFCCFPFFFSPLARSGYLNQQESGVIHSEMTTKRCDQRENGAKKKEINRQKKKKKCDEENERERQGTVLYSPPARALSFSAHILSTALSTTACASCSHFVRSSRSMLSSNRISC